MKTLIVSRKLIVFILVILLCLCGLHILGPRAEALTPVRDRTPQVRDALIAASGVAVADDVTAAHLLSIRELDLSDRSITSLQVGDFEGLWYLRELSLARNALTTLPEQVFEELDRLEVLHLNGNALTALPPLVFSILNELTHLSLHNNDLTTLPAVLFDTLRDLEELRLARNALTALPAGLFDDLTVLRHLSLRRNALTALPADIFHTLTELESLMLDRNQLTALPAGIFKNLGALNLLYLQQNPVPLTLTVSCEMVSMGRFKATVDTGAPFDIVLPLIVNNGEMTTDVRTLTIPQGSLESEPLVVTRMSGMQGAVSVNIGALPGLPSQHQGYTLVKSVALPVDVMPSNAAPVFTEGSQTTRRVPEDAAAGVNIGEPITATDAENDPLTYSLSGPNAAMFSIDMRTGQLKTAQTLDYEAESSYTVIVAVSDGMQTTTITVTIEVADVAVTEVDNMPLADRTPQVRDAIRAALAALPAWARGNERYINYIYSLNLTGKNIQALKAGDFSGLSSLRVLYLGRNQLTTLPEGVFTGLTSLRWLHLFGNRISHIDAGAFSGLTSLEEINLHTNRLSRLPANLFDGLSSLIWLSLHNNRLTDLPEGLFSGLSSLYALNLSNNALTALPDGVFRGYTPTTYANGYLQLQGNAVDPLSLAVSIEKVGDTGIKVVAPAGAPFDMVLPLTVNNGSLEGGVTTLTIVSGGLESGTLTLTRTPGTTGAVSVDIGALPQLPTRHRGYVLAKSGSLPLAVIPGVAGAPTVTAAQVPNATALLANYPNPFNPETWIPYRLAKPSEVQISIYDARGSVVRQLDLGHRSAGLYQTRSRAVYWDGRNNFGESVASGVYFYTLTAGDFTATRRMLIVK